MLEIRMQLPPILEKMPQFRQAVFDEVTKTSSEIAKSWANKIPAQTGDTKWATVPADTIDDGAEISGGAENLTPVALFLEKGTGIYGPKGRAFVIRPSTAKCLAFMWGGVKFLRNKVTIQGIRPRNYMAETFEEWKTLFPSRISEKIMEVLGK